MEIALLIIACLVVGVAAGWFGRSEAQRRQNRRFARGMAKAVQATKSRRDPADMMEYGSRQRTAGNIDNTKRARQPNVRFRGRSLRR